MDPIQIYAVLPQAGNERRSVVVEAAHAELRLAAFAPHVRLEGRQVKLAIRRVARAALKERLTAIVAEGRRPTEVAAGPPHGPPFRICRYSAN